MATKVLNLDRLIEKAPQRVLSYKGIEHPIKEMSVEDFLKLTKVAEELEKGSTLGQQIEANIELLADAIPTMDRDELRKIPVEHLAALARFVRGDDMTESDGVEKNVEDGEKKE